MHRPALLLIVLAVAMSGSPAYASRLTAVPTPSRFVDPSRVVFNGADHPSRLMANVLLPDDYKRSRRYPVLYLLHGVGDAYDDWADPRKGDIAEVAKGFPGIIVMPEGARGFYTDWFNKGLRGDPAWESYDLKELIPIVERRFPIRAGRRWHAIAGFSMGGFGATYLATQRPGYFGTSMTSQGFVSIQRPELEVGLPLVGQVNYADIYGPRDGPYATGHNPVKLTDNLRHTRLYVTVGDGTDPEQRSSLNSQLAGGPVEAALRLQSDELAAAARASSVDMTYVVQPGVHDWPFRRDHLRDAIAWGLFEKVPEHPRRWTYRTVSRTGNMWGLRFRFSRPPATVERFERDGRWLRGQGSGQVRIRTRSGRSFTETLPFARRLTRRALEDRG